MSRFAVVFTVISCLLVSHLSTTSGELLQRKRTPSKGLKLGQELTAAIDKAPGELRLQGGGLANFYTKVPISLKSGQSITISVSVVGEGRRVALAFLDPSSQVIKINFNTEIKTATLEIKEVGETAEHMIAVYSDRGGNFTLRVDDDNSPETDEPKPSWESLEKRIKTLEVELISIKKELDILKRELQSK